MPNSNNRLLELYLTYDQWKEEHDALHERLLELCRFMKWNPTNYEFHDWDDHHRKVSAKFVPFMKDWSAHLAKERQMVYPVADSFLTSGPIGPVAALEQDVNIALYYYDSYKEALEAGASAEDALYRLLQVVIIVAEHFRVEDETILPATERLMEQIEYGGS